MRPSIKCPHCGTHNEADPELATCWKCGKLLAPGEVVAAAPAPKPPKRTRPACVRPYLSADLGRRIEQLRKLLAEAERQYEEGE